MSITVSMTAVLDTLESQIAVIDSSGTIHFVNLAWREFAVKNGLAEDFPWIGSSYLTACMHAATSGDAAARSSAEGMQSVIDEKTGEYCYEYPCHSAHELRWFMMRFVPMHETPGFFVVSHHNITLRKLIEEKIQRQNDELTRLASTDPLTQVANRLKLNATLDAEIYRAERYASPLSIILLDVDHFKNVNDVHGHPSGDSVLAGVAGILVANVRDSDVVGRWGGEEFLIILPGCDITAAQLLAEKLRRTLAAHAFPLVGHITCSFGVTALRSGDTASALISSADTALYRAKNSGRNCVCTADSE